MLAFFPYLNDFIKNILDQGWYFRILFIMIMAVIVPIAWGLCGESKEVLLELRNERRRRDWQNSFENDN